MERTIRMNPKEFILFLLPVWALTHFWLLPIFKNRWVAGDLRQKIARTGSLIFIEKIRGQELDLRHILIQPEISQSVLDAAKAELDTIRKKIINEEFTFAEAALNFSDEKETKFDGGLLRNPVNFDSKFELTKMDPTLYNQVQNLKDNEITYPVLEQDQRGGAPKYKILKITNRYDEHVADFSKDYTKIQELALTEKKYNAIKKWMDKHIKDTYISVNDQNKDCEFANNWVKE